MTSFKIWMAETFPYPRRMDLTLHPSEVFRGTGLRDHIWELQGVFFNHGSKKATELHNEIVKEACRLESEGKRSTILDQEFEEIRRRVQE